MITKIPKSILESVGIYYTCYDSESELSHSMMARYLHGAVDPVPDLGKILLIDRTDISQDRN